MREFVAEKLPEPASQRTALRVVSMLLRLLEQHGRKVAHIDRERLELEFAAYGGAEDDPVHGWRYALPLALPADARRDVSRVLGAVVKAAEPKLRLV